MDEHGPQLSWQWTADLRGFLKMSSSSTSSWWASSMGGKDLSDIMIPLFLMDFRDLLSPLEWTWETTFIWTDLRVLISPKSWTLFLMEAWSWTGKDLFRCLKIHWSKIWICAEYFVTKHNWIILVWKILRRLLSQLSKIKMLFQIFCKIFPWFFGDISANMTSAASLLLLSEIYKDENIPVFSSEWLWVRDEISGLLYLFKHSTLTPYLKIRTPALIALVAVAPNI